MFSLIVVWTQSIHNVSRYITLILLPVDVEKC